MSGIEGTKNATANASGGASAENRFFNLNRKIDDAAVRLDALVRAEQAKLVPKDGETPKDLKMKAREVVATKVQSALKAERPADEEQRKLAALAKELLKIHQDRAPLRAEFGDPGAVVANRNPSHPSKEMEWRAIPGTPHFVSSYKPSSKFVVGSTVSFELEHPHFETKLSKPFCLRRHGEHIGRLG